MRRPSLCAVVAGASLLEAVVLSWFLEEAPRVERANTAPPPEYVAFSSDEVAARRVTAGRVYERMWDYLTSGRCCCRFFLFLPTKSSFCSALVFGSYPFSAIGETRNPLATPDRPNQASNPANPGAAQYEIHGQNEPASRVHPSKCDHRRTEIHYDACSNKNKERTKRHYATDDSCHRSSDAVENQDMRRSVDISSADTVTTCRRRLPNSRRDDASANLAVPPSTLMRAVAAVMLELGEQSFG
jgi:hypothetical protein